MLEPAKTIIEIFGGVDKVAEVAERNRTNVHRWGYPKDKGGTGGLIPSESAEKLYKYAQENDLPITAEHFLSRNAAELGT